LKVKPRNQSDVFDDIQELIREQLVEKVVPSLAVAVAKDGVIVWEEGFGWADRENRVLANEHTMYSLASISKPITATGLMILKERGELDLDKPINDYLGETKLKAWVGSPCDATVRRVANHSAGLPLHYQFFYEDEPSRPPSMDETIRRYGNIVTAPGEGYKYSNIGYGILDYVISRISGKSYSDFMREEVFLPLDMTRTSVHIGRGHMSHHAVRYGTDGLPIPFYDFDHRGASAVYSSAHDLIRFGMFHLKAHLHDQKRILSDEAIDEMQRSTVTVEEDVGYGIGWRVSAEADYSIVNHSGGMGGVATRLVLVPSERLAVVVLCNAAQQDLTRLIFKEILSILLPGYRDHRARVEAKEEGNDKEEPAKSRSPPELLGKWSGVVHTYKEDLPFDLSIKDSGDVQVKLGAQLTTLLNDVSFDDGYLQGRLAGDIGTEDANRRPYHLHVELKHRDAVLNGSVTAVSLPGQRAGNALSHWAELVRQ
jgi:CubicO group peptidase (beta-lactamase class C family)